LICDEMRERERERQKFTHRTLMSESARIFTSWFWTWAQLYKEGTGKLKECSQDRERERNIHSLLTDFVISYVHVYYDVYIYHTYVCMYVREYVCICIWVCRCMCICIFICICTCKCICCVRTYVFMYKCIHMHIYM